MNIGDKSVNIGIMYRREHAPERLPAFARDAEAAGFDELWIVEDCFYGSGVAQAAAALAVTGSLTVGLGIMPAVVRNPAFAAMEIASTARMFPGRFLPGFGHGVEGWMRQVGAYPRSPLTALEETVVAVKRLLAGENVTFDGQYVHLADSQLLFPPAESPPLSLGVRGEKSLRLSGRIADGTILAEYASPAYIQWARQQIAAGQIEAGITRPHRLTVFAICYLNVDVNRAYEQARASVIAAISRGSGMISQLKPMGILPQLEMMRGRNALEAEMPETWVHDLVIFGNPEQCRAAVLRLVEAGVDSIVLVPPTDQALEMPSEIGGRLLRFLK